MKITWVCTTACNLNCAYCCGIEKEKVYPALSPADIFDYFDSIRKNNEIDITGGEPLNYPKFIEIIEYLIHNNEITLNTNLINPIIKELAHNSSSEHFLDISPLLKGTKLFIGNGV